MTKSQARILYKKRRSELSEEDLKAKDIKIHDLLFSRLMMHRYSPIHIFLPIKIKNEPDTYRIINTLRKDFAPDIFIGKSLENGELLHLKYEASTILKANQWGINEPKELSQALDSNAFFKKYEKEDTLIFVPLLAFDKKGNRVGYGKGYYDRFLLHATKDTIIVGLSLFEPIDLIEDIDKYDIKMNFCITPNRVWAW